MNSMCWLHAFGNLIFVSDQLHLVEVCFDHCCGTARCYEYTTCQSLLKHGSIPNTLCFGINSWPLLCVSNLKWDMRCEIIARWYAWCITRGVNYAWSIFLYSIVIDGLDWESTTMSFDDVKVTQTTPTYLNHAASVLVRGAIFYKPKIAYEWPYKYPKYLGYIAELGSNITITCNTDLGSLSEPGTIKFRPAWYKNQKREIPLSRYAKKDQQRYVKIVLDLHGVLGGCSRVIRNNPSSSAVMIDTLFLYCIFFFLEKIEIFKWTLL
mgnify:CR=1 FL=1